MPEPNVQRDVPLPLSEHGIVLYCDDSPERPGHEPQPGEVGWKLIFPLYDGLTLMLFCGKETYKHFVAILAASAADDADDELKGT